VMRVWVSLWAFIMGMTTGPIILLVTETLHDTDTG
jgi:hypothetical protein